MFPMTPNHHTQREGERGGENKDRTEEAADSEVQRWPLLRDSNHGTTREGLEKLGFRNPIHCGLCTTIAATTPVGGWA